MRDARIAWSRKTEWCLLPWLSVVVPFLSPQPPRMHALVAQMRTADPIGCCGNNINVFLFMWEDQKKWRTKENAAGWRDSQLLEGGLASLRMITGWGNQLWLLSNREFLLEMISAAQLFPSSVWNFPGGKRSQIKNDN